MTETANRSGARRKGGKGVKVERISTTPGVHPYDEVTWERRDVVQTNWKTGCLLYTSPSPRDGLLSRMPSSA